MVKPLVPAEPGHSVHAKTKKLTRLFEKYVKLSANLPTRPCSPRSRRTTPAGSPTRSARNLNVDLSAKQDLLEVVDIEAVSTSSSRW